MHLWILNLHWLEKYEYSRKQMNINFILWRKVKLNCDCSVFFSYGIFIFYISAVLSLFHDIVFSFISNIVAGFLPLSLLWRFQFQFDFLPHHFRIFLQIRISNEYQAGLHFFPSIKQKFYKILFNLMQNV